MRRVDRQFRYRNLLQKPRTDRPRFIDDRKDMTLAIAGGLLWVFIWYRILGALLYA